jgi:hypothetical protein
MGFIILTPSPPVTGGKVRVSLDQVIGYQGTASGGTEIVSRDSRTMAFVETPDQVDWLIGQVTGKPPQGGA